MNILEKIVKKKKDELPSLHMQLESLTALAKSQPEPRPFLKRLKDVAFETAQPALIAEIKKASPSKGVIRHHFDPIQMAMDYEAGGAAALSVLTDAEFFQGHLHFLSQARSATSLPALRKDFIIDPIQVVEARSIGADAILLIASILDPMKLAELFNMASEWGMDVLVEIHDEADWSVVVSSEITPKLVGINNRDLKTFEVNLETTERLIPEVRNSGAFIVSESGIFSPKDVERARKAGAGAVLVGEALAKEENLLIATRNLLGKD